VGQVLASLECLFAEFHRSDEAAIVFHIGRKRCVHALSIPPPRSPHPQSRYTAQMDTIGQLFEEFKVKANELGAKIHDLIHEGNVRRIIIKDEQGHTFMEIPLTVATVGVILAPLLAAVGAIATFAAHFHIVVERTSAPTGAAADSAPSASTDASVGATESQVNMNATVPQHGDNKGTHVEDIAGTGEHDSLGG
jgi:hypothetical protein